MNSKKRPTEYRGLGKDEYNELINQSYGTNESQVGIQRASESELQTRRRISVGSQWNNNNNNNNNNKYNNTNNDNRMTNHTESGVMTGTSGGTSASSSTSSSRANPFSNVQLTTTASLPPSLFGNRPTTTTSGSSTGSTTVVAANNSSSSNNNNSSSSSSATTATTNATIEKARKQINRHFTSQLFEQLRPPPPQQQQQQFNNRHNDYSSKTTNPRNSQTSTKSWVASMKYYLAQHMKFDEEAWELLDQSSSCNTGSGSRTIIPHPVTANTTTTVPTPVAQPPAAVTMNSNPFGNFAPASTVTPTVNLFQPHPTTAVSFGSNNNNNNNNSSNETNNDEDGDVPEESNPDDKIRRDHDPNWIDIGEYENIQFYYDKDLLHGTMGKFCSGTVWIQSHVNATTTTTTTMLSRMVVRSSNGMNVLINIGLSHNMTFTLKLMTTSKNKEMGQIFFKGLNDVQRGNELFIMKCIGTTAKQLHTQLVQITSAAP